MHIAKQIETMLVDGTFHRIVVFAAQPSDTIRVAGELLQLASSVSADVRIVIMTEGLPAPWSHRVLVDSSRHQAMLKCRLHDAEQALMTLGITRGAMRFLDYPSGELSEGLITHRANLIQAVVSELEDFRATLVLSPSRCDLDADNSAIGIVMSHALRQLNALSPVHLSYIVNGPAPAIPLVNRLPLPQDERRVAIKQRALEQVTRTRLDRKRHAKTVETPPQEIFIESEMTAQMGTLFCAMQNACKTHIAFTCRSEHERLWVYPADAHMHPARLALNFSSALQLGNRQSDLIHVERDSSGISLNIEAYIDPLWIKIDPGEGTDSLDCLGWHRVQPVLCSASKRVACVLPCFNVADHIESLLERVSNNADCIVAVDDGSTDATLTKLESAARYIPSLQILSYAQNHGKGHALLAGLRHALATTDCGVLVTMNADNQHNAENIAALVDTLRGSDAVMTVGVRNRHGALSLRELLINRLVSALTQVTYGKIPADIGSGFRALTRDFTIRILEQVQGSRYTTEIEIMTLALKTNRVASVCVDDQDQEGRRPPGNTVQFGDSLRMLASLIRCCLSRSPESLNSH